MRVARAFSHGIMLTTVMLSLGCGEPVPTRPAMIVQQSLTSAVELTINGQNPQVTPLTLQRETEVDVQASYTRPGNEPATWGRTVLFFVPVDPQRRVRAEYGLGSAESEKVKGKDRVWECCWSKGLPGRKIKLLHSPGEYDLLLCWQRDRVTVADEIAYDECPLNLAIPLWQARITVVDPNKQ